MSRLTATLTSPRVLVQGKVGVYELNLPLTVEQARQLRDALIEALRDAEAAA